MEAGNGNYQSEEAMEKVDYDLKGTEVILDLMKKMQMVLIGTLNCEYRKIKIATRNINNLRYADETTLMAETEEELKSLLRRVKEESKKSSLKLNIKKKKTQN